MWQDSAEEENAVHTIIQCIPFETSVHFRWPSFVFSYDQKQIIIIISGIYWRTTIGIEYNSK